MCTISSSRAGEHMVTSELCDRKKVVFNGNVPHSLLNSSISLILERKTKKQKSTFLRCWTGCIMVQRGGLPIKNPYKMCVLNTWNTSPTVHLSPSRLKPLNRVNQSGCQTTRAKRGTVGVASNGPGWYPELIRDGRGVPVLVMGHDRLVEGGEPDVLCKKLGCWRV